MAVLTMAVLSGLLGAVFLLVLYSHRSGVALVASDQAQYLAEEAAHRSLDAWEPSVLVGFPPGTTATAQSGLILGGESRVTAFGDGIFLFQGSVGGKLGSRRTVGLTARLIPPSVVIDRALSTDAPVSIQAGASVTMTNASEEALCGPLGVGLREAFEVDSLEPFDTWAGRAGTVFNGGITLVPRPSFSSLGCDATDPLNWGDPRGGSTCTGHFPAVLVRGDLIVQGGTGQGVLAVEGHVTLGAGFMYRGLIIVQGGLDASDVMIEGAVQVSGPSGVGVVVGEGTSIRYSPCALNRALVRFGAVRPLDRRAWVQLY